MKVKPILFNTEMVQAIQDARKTVTRRVLKPQPTEYLTCGPNWKELLAAAAAPVHPGDVLWVRETWGNYGYDNEENNATYFLYRADYSADAKGYWFEPEHINFCDFPRWRPSIHMPKEAARLFLRVTDVRVERLQDVRESGARAEGLMNNVMTDGGSSACKKFSILWDATIRRLDLPRYGWEANPWVWVISFEPCEKPVGWTAEAPTHE